MSFVFYDTETTGVETKFDQILQFAAIHTDESFVEQGDVNRRCKRLPHIVPTPGALMVTKVTPQQLEGANSSHYQMFREIQPWLSSKSPSVYIGYNSIRFDEVLLRQAFYQTLQPLYLTNTNGNCRADMMLIAQAAKVYAPHSLEVPLGNRGNYVFKLGEVVRANNIDFSEDSAHDALADVRATIDLAKFISANAPEVWDAMIRNARKDHVNAFVGEHRVFCLTNFFFGRSYTNVVTLGGRNTENGNEIAVCDLAHDPSDYINLDIDGLLDVLTSSPKKIRTARVNAQPIFMPFNNVPDEIHGERLDDATYSAHAEMIHNDQDFQARLGQALAMRYEDAEPSPYVEGKIYDAFPTQSDTAKMELFHTLPNWEGRYALCAEFEDARIAELGRRLVYAEQPNAVPDADRPQFDQWVRERLLTDSDVPWTTISKALLEADDMLGQRPESANELNSIKDFLKSLADQYA